MDGILRLDDFGWFLDVNQCAPSLMVILNCNSFLCLIYPFNSGLIISNSKIRLWREDFVSCDVEPLWIAPKFAKSAANTVQMVNLNELEDEKTPRKRKKKRKRSQIAENLDDGLPPLDYVPNLDPILQACMLPVIQGFDYPQHAACVPILEKILSRLNAIDIVPLGVCEPEDLALVDPFPTCLERWQTPNKIAQPEMLDMTLVESLWQVPLRNETSQFQTIHSANHSWLLPPRSSCFMVRFVSRN